jgi:hypothetical protein
LSLRARERRDSWWKLYRRDACYQKDFLHMSLIVSKLSRNVTVGPGCPARGSARARASGFTQVVESFGLFPPSS